MTKKLKAEIGKAEMGQPAAIPPIALARTRLAFARRERTKCYRERVRLYKLSCAAAHAWMEAQLDVQEREEDLRDLLEVNGLTRYPEHKPEGMELH